MSRSFIGRLAAPVLVMATLAAGAIGTAAPAAASPHFYPGYGHHGGWYGPGYRHGSWRGGRWIAPVAVGAALVGTAAAYDYGYRRCFFERRYDEAGYDLGRVRICRTVAY